MGEMADFALDQLDDEDAAQLETLGTSNVYQTVREIPRNCAACGTALILRNGKFGPFFGCPNFPKCKSKGYACRDVGHLSEAEQAVMNGEMPPR